MTVKFLRLTDYAYRVSKSGGSISPDFETRRGVVAFQQPVRMRNLLILLMTSIMTPTGAHAGPAELILWIEKEVTGENQVTLTPYVKTPSFVNLRYSFKVDKHGKSGRSTTRQSGRLSIQSGQSKALSTLALHLKPEDRYRVELKLYDENRLVAELVSEAPDSLP